MLMNMYDYETNASKQPLSQNDQQICQIGDPQQFELEQIESNKLKKADFESSIFAALVIENMITIAIICLSLFTKMQFWFVDGTLDINYFCYCKYQNSEECYDECVYQKNQVNNLKPTALFYCVLIIGIIMQIWLNVGLTYIRKQNKLLIFLYLAILFVSYIFTLATYCILIAYIWGINLVFTSLIINFVFIFCTAFYTTRTKTLINYKIGLIYIFIPTLVMFIILLSIYTDSVIYIFLNCAILDIHGFFILYEIQKIRCNNIFQQSNDDVLIGLSMVFGSINQSLFRLIELCQKQQQ